MKKTISFFKKSKCLYITLGLGLGFSLPQLTINYLPKNSVKSIGVGQNYSRSILRTSKTGNLIKIITNSEQRKKSKTCIEKTTVNIIKPDLKTINSGKKRYHYQEMRLMEATAYYPGPECTGKYSVYGKTYTGKKARYGLVAVDPKVIPLGTKLYIEGYGKAEAADIGGAIKGNKIDLCFNTYKEAKKFGRKKIKVYLLK